MSSLMSLMMDYKDPWKWSVDDVVANFCCPGPFWSDAADSAPPDVESLKAAVRRNHMTGPALLEHVDMHVLKDEFDIKTLGDRAEVLHAIERLRNSSSGYVVHRANIHARDVKVKARASEFTPGFTPALATPQSTVYPTIENRLRQIFPQPMPSAIKSENSVNLRPGETLVDNGPRKRRKLKPNQLQPVLPNLKSEADNSYLGRLKVKLDAVFYDKHPKEQDESDSEDGFSLPQGQFLPAGKRKFVHGRVKHMLQTSPARVNDQLVIHPYPERLVKDGNARSATVISLVDGKAVATRKNASFIDSTLNAYDNDTEQDTSWDFLVKWSKKKDDEILPVYNESGSENDYDSSLLDEIELETTENANAPQSKYLTRDEVNEIIGEAVQRFRSHWQEEKEPQRERKAYALWRKGHGRQGHFTLQAARKKLGELQTRLDKLKRHISDEQWMSRKTLQKQCHVLEPTVDSLSKNEWELKVLNGPPPSRVVQPRRTKLKQAKHVDSDEGDDLVESSDSASEPADDFIVPDAGVGDMRNIHEEPMESNHASKTHDDHSRRSSSSVDSVLGHTEFRERTPSPLERFRRGDMVDGEAAEEEPSEDIDDKVSIEVNKEVVDLTLNSRSRSPENSDTHGVDYDVAPEDAKDSDVAKWAWTTLLEQADCKRIVLKLLREMERSLREKVQEQLFREFEKVEGEILKALQALQNGRPSIVGIDTNSLRTEAMFTLARLWTCWVTGRNEPINEDLDEDTIASANRNLEDFCNFWDFLHSVTKAANESESEDSDPITPKKKKKTVIMDRKVREMREQAHHRSQVGHARQLEFQSQIQTGVMDPSELDMLINIGKTDEEDPISLNSHIAQRIKPHQMKGIRFMWREVVESARDLRQGCLLAHTMGLGKTMQTISVLVTIAEASRSKNPNIARQIPRELRTLRTLILCPAVLIGNWEDEFKKWLPAHSPNNSSIKPIRAITAATPIPDRLATIASWYDDGGVLILSYDMFRAFTSRVVILDDDAEAGLHTLSQSDRNKIRQQLLEGPSIVVADEAHRLKNRGTAIGAHVHEFKTTSRIALTGSPLANNLHDYYAMIDWVAPNYLGDEKEFKAYYQDPIEQGTYADSSSYQQRRSLKKLKALKTDIAPKVDRADITVLQGDLTSKTEFVITLPLTGIQQRAYSAFINIVKGPDKVTNTRMWDWLHLLGSLCNHPSLLYSVLAERVAEKKNGGKGKLKKKPKQDTTKLSDPTLALAKQLLKRMKEEGVTKDKSANLSAKIPIINAIVEECKELGEQVLVFTHHQHMLDYLELTLPKLPSSPRCFRLDGNTEMSKRLGLVKEFNQGAVDVFLISTRAGGLGLNIAAANRVILCDFGFNPSHEEQAVGRAYRIGQKKDVFVYHLVTGGTYEEKLHHVTIFKHQLAQRVVDDKNPKRAASKTGEYFFDPQPVKQSILDESYGKDKVMDKIRYAAAGQSIRNLQTTETMHADSEEHLDEAEEKEVREMIEDDKLRRNDHAAWQKKNYTASAGVNLARPPFVTPSTAASTLDNVARLPPPSVLGNLPKLPPPSAHGPSAPQMSSPTAPTARMVQPVSSTERAGAPPAIPAATNDSVFDRDPKQPIKHKLNPPAQLMQGHGLPKPSRPPSTNQPHWLHNGTGHSMMHRPVPGPAHGSLYRNNYTGLTEEGQHVNSDIPPSADQKFLAQKQKQDMIDKVGKTAKRVEREKKRQQQQPKAERRPNMGGHTFASPIELDDSD